MLQLNDIKKAYELIKQHIFTTPLQLSQSSSQRLGCEVYFKYENTQHTGSFKIRGALNKILNLSEQERARGIVASSAGNHAQGVASSATQVKAKAHIVMPVNSPLVKVLATQHYGAEVILHGQVYDEAYTHARELEKKHGYTFVHAFDDPLVMAGQGTIGLEIYEQLADLDSIVIPIGGGGLISGVATALKALMPKVRIYGVVSDQAPGMFQLYRKQAVQKPSSVLTIADGIAVKNPSEQIYRDYISRLVDDVIAVNDDEIAEAIVWLLERGKTLVEGSGATVMAAASKGKWNLGKKTCLLLSGGNIDLNIISLVIDRGLSQRGRLARITVVVPDRPGELMRLTNILAEKKANVLDVKHDRLRPDLLISETAIEFLVESRSEDHIKELREALGKVSRQVK